MMRISIFLFFFACLPSLALSQGKVMPLQSNPQQQALPDHRTMKIAAAGDTIGLPLFDDFTTSDITPDASIWLTNGGTYIGNNFAVNPPNFNVATFDGLDANGNPYNISAPLTTGPADNLTSKAIDLSTYLQKDSVYLRFFWQGDGLGDFPDFNKDSIILQFKDRSNGWKTVWKETTDSTGFNLKHIAVDSSQYYHEGFQFRFQSYGRLSGAYDVWNIDYIMLDTGRLARDNWAPDMSFKGPPTSYLRKYTAMPIKQFLADRAGETADTCVVSLVSISHFDRIVDLPDTLNLLTDIQSGNVINMNTSNSKYVSNTLVTKPSSSFYYGQDTVKYIPVNTAINGPEVPRILKLKFALSYKIDTISVSPLVIDTIASDPRTNRKYRYSSTTDSVISRIDFARNDSVSGYTYLTDYYACDDGSAEGAYGVNQNLGKVAVRYDLNTADTLTYLSFCFPKVHQQFLNEPITLMVWTGITEGSSNANLLYHEDVILDYSGSLNGFQTFMLKNPIIFNQPGSFWIGYQQYRDEYMYITGFDKNTNHNDRIYVNVNDVWQKENYEKGSLMIRAGFRNQFITGTESRRRPELEAKIFPNPAQNELNIAARIETAQLYDLSGRLLLSQTFNGHVQELHTLNVSSLPNGMYLLHLENEEAKTVKKIVISR